MKKFFYYSVAAAIAFTLGSCSDDEDPVIVNPLVQNVQAFGTRSTGIDVTIGNVEGFAAVTRGCDVNGNMWPELPAVPSAEEVAGVMEYIKNNSDKNIDVTSWNWTYYYVQHVGGAHNKYSYTDWNGAKHDNIDGTSSMEFLQILEFSGNWQHVYNFNAGKCDNGATNNSALMTNGFQDAKTLNEYSSSTITAWRLYEYNGSFYLGFDFSAKKGDGEIPGDGVYDDWVIKLIPGAGEKNPTPCPMPTKPGNDPDDDDPSTDPDDVNTPLVPEVEVDIHHQSHKDWNELKVSVHLRDTVNVRVFIPVSLDLQAMPDDFDIRTGIDYDYIDYIDQTISEVQKVKFNVASEEFEIDVQINHRATGIEILLAGADCAKALHFARGIYDDGITFEIHSYLYPTLTADAIWNDILKKIEIPETSLTRWPGDGSCVTHTYGQIHSAYYEDELIPFVKDPE
ncbi:MAG: hypothetical protein KBT20_07585 [Bacteroidales bacterium]|nr:hypothetical protein [Candidatus Liminaster caballi]